MQLEVNGMLYTNFESARVDISLSSLSRGFVFDAISTEGLPLPFKGGEPCRVIVDGETVLTGNIEIVKVDYADRTHSISLKGRSTTGDVVDSTMRSLEINPPISLKSVIEQALLEIGVDITVIDDSGGIDDFNKAEDKIGPAVGENAFDFIETLARKRQVLLTTNDTGNIVIESPEPQLIKHQLLNIIGNPLNNILSGSVSYDHTSRFRDYLIKSQQNTSSLVFSGSADLSTIVDQGGSAQDLEVRVGRKFVAKAEKASSSEESKNRATWEGNIRKTRSAVYSATVLGYRTVSGDLWEVNKLVQIVDEYADINARMLLDSVSFSLKLGEGGGKKTTLGFVDKDAYKVQLEEPTGPDKVGEDLFG